MREVLADLTQAGRFKELDRKCKKAAKMAVFNRLFSPMSSYASSHKKTTKAVPSYRTPKELRS